MVHRYRTTDCHLLGNQLIISSVVSAGFNPLEAGFAAFLMLSLFKVNSRLVCVEGNVGLVKINRTLIMFDCFFKFFFLIKFISKEFFF